MAGESLADVFRRLAAKSGGIIPRDWGDWCECLALWRVNLRAWRASAKSYAARYGRRARLTRLAVYQRETARQHAREVIEALRLIRDSLAAAARAKALHVEVEMLLPAGKRCRDCAHRARCVWLLTPLACARRRVAGRTKNGRRRPGLQDGQSGPWTALKTPYCRFGGCGFDSRRPRLGGEECLVAGGE